jgi:hypothetical protein
MLAKNKIDKLSLAVGALIVTAVCAHIFFSSGHTYNLDGANHSLKSLMVYQSIKEGDFPLWSNLGHGGFAFLQFYPPLFYFLAGVLNLLFQNIIITIKTLGFLAQILSGFTAYLLAKEISGSRRAGIIAGLAYSLSPWHVFHIIIFARATHSFIYSLLPLPFYFYERFRNGKGSFLKASIKAGFSLFLIISIQYGYAIFCTYFFILFTLLDSFRSPRSRPLLDNGKFLLTSGFVAAGVGLFLLLPFLTEVGNMSGQLYGENFLDKKKFNVDSATFEALYTRRGGPVFHKGYIGAGFALLSLLGAAEAFRRKRYVLIALYGLAVFFVLGHETSIYRYIPLIYTQQATARLIIYQIFFMAILAGLGWDIIEKFLQTRNNISYLTEFIFVLLLAVLVWDVSIMFNTVEWNKSYYGLRPVYESLNKEMTARGDRKGRVTHLFVESGMDWMTNTVLPSIQVLESHAPALRSIGFGYELPRSGIYIEGGREWLRDEILQYGAFKNSTDFLHLMDIAYVIFVGPDRKIKISTFFPHSPIFASGNVISISDQGKDPKELCRTIIPRMKLNKDTATAENLFSLDPFPDYQPLPTPHIQLVDYRQTVNRTHLTVRSDQDTYLRISHAYYKYLSLNLDGKAIPFYPSTLGFILVRFPAGTHSIEISPIFSPLRKGAMVFSLLFFIACLAFYYHQKKRPVPASGCS